tara:strand:- start:4141 stop:4440 length:300 start_codon:yes stop_codon:yes gene_type:complete
MGDKNTSSNIPITETVRQRLVEVIKRQTDYDDDMIIKKLKDHNNNVVDIIREFMNPNNKPVKSNKITPKTTNQKVFSEIRKLMDAASEAHRKKKELETQ